MSRQYLSAGAIVEEYLKGRSLKGFCASLKNIDKVEYAIALQTIKYYEIITKIFDKCSIHADELDVKRGVLLVMVYDLLFGRGNINGGGKVKKIVMSNIDNIKQALAGYMDGMQHHSELLSANVRESSKLGYFIRINPFKISIAEGLDYIRTTCPDAMIDSDIPSLIVLPTVTRSFGQDRWVKEGKLIIQDKASCFPSQILFDYWQDIPISIGGTGGDIIDACAAPGNKTSHIAGLTAGKGISIFAFEKNSRRVTVLRDRMKLLGVNNVKVIFNDFLEVNVHDPCYRNVHCILLDPSCSGSGVLRSLDRAVEVVVDDDEAKKNARLTNLQSFQIQMILKAMSFPAVRMIAYSTCSIYKQENEHVVRKVLAAHQQQQQVQHKSSEWVLVSPSRFSQWKNRGLSDDGNKDDYSGGIEDELSPDQLSSLIRCSSDDGTNGFFVALFHRITSEVIAHDDDGGAPQPPISVNNYNDNNSLKAEIKSPQLKHNKVESKKQKLRDVEEARNRNTMFCGSKLFKVRSRKRK